MLVLDLYFNVKVRSGGKGVIKYNNSAESQSAETSCRIIGQDIIEFTPIKNDECIIGFR